jgi:quinol-cytochrome oxidoreductase complex cytochrome b subunit
LQKRDVPFAFEDHIKMHAATNLVVALGVAAVAFVLLLGLINTLREGSPYVSQKLMRWRVGVQFAVIIIIMVVLWLTAKH